MRLDLFKMALELTSAHQAKDHNIPIGAPVTPSLKKVGDRGFSYTERHRGRWFKPPYDLEEIQIAQDTDSYLFRAIQKKVNRVLVAGWEIVGKNPTTVEYIKKRLTEIQLTSGKPFNLLIAETAQDLIRYSNCMWVKVRNEKASSGNVRTYAGSSKELEPVAGYFILPFETLLFKTKSNGEIKKVMQKTPSGETKEFAPIDVIHFYKDKKAGFPIGTPEFTPAIEDIALLRRLEENVEELIDSNLYPLFHYQVGSDVMPERYSPEGEKETDIVRRTVEYMPAGGIYISDHRHKISAIGSEGRALRIEAYLDYFKKRVFAGLGVSSVDMGEGDTANRSTAQTLSKSAILDVEALQFYMKLFIESFVFSELLLEGNFGLNAFEHDNRVEIKFGTVDKEENAKLENQTIQLWLNKLLTENEARKRLGEKPIVQEDREETYFKLYEEPLALIKGLGMPAADEALADSPASSITPEGVRKQAALREKELTSKQVTGRPNNPASIGSQRASGATSRPSNQHGTRPGPKLTQDLVISDNFLIDSSHLEDSFVKGFNSANGTLPEDDQPDELESLKTTYGKRVEELVALSKKRIYNLKGNVKVGTILSSLQWRLDELNNEFAEKSYKLGISVVKLDL